MRPSQLKLILDVVKKVYGKGKDIEELQFWQFKEIL